MRKIFIILFCLLIASPSFAGTTPLFDLWKFFKGAKLVKIPSYNSGPFPNEFITLKDGSYKNSPVKIDALMVFPKKGEGPFPMLVFNHASGGARLFHNEWFKLNRQMAKVLLKKGMAVMFVDNFFNDVSRANVGFAINKEIRIINIFFMFLLILKFDVSLDLL